MHRKLLFMCLMVLPTLANAARNYFYAESDSTSTTTSTSFQDKVSLFFTPTANATYFYLASGQINRDSVFGATWMRLFQSSSTILYQEIQKNESAITDYLSYGMLGVQSFGSSPTSQGLKIQYRANGTGNSSINYARIVALEANANDTYVQVLSTGSTSSTSFQQFAVAGSTPSTTGNYLLVVSAEGAYTAGGDRIRYRIKVDGVAISTAAHQANINVYNGYAHALVYNLTNTGHAISLEYASGNGNSVSIRNARIFVIRLTDTVNHVYTSSNTTRATTTSTTFIDGISTVASVQATSHLVIGANVLDNTSNANSSYTQFSEGSSLKMDVRWQPVNTNELRAFFSVFVSNPSGTTTWKHQYRTDSATTTGYDEQRAFAVQLGEDPAPPSITDNAPMFGTEF